MSETRFSRSRSKSSVNAPTSKPGIAQGFQGSHLVKRWFQRVPPSSWPPTTFSTYNPQDPSPAGPGTAYNAAPSETHKPQVTSPSTQPNEGRLRDEFWLAPLVVLVVIVWLRLALDAMGILPMNLGY